VKFASTVLPHFLWKQNNKTVEVI